MSLTNLKSLRSNAITPIAVPWRSRTSIASARRRLNRARLARPVRGSCSACSATADSSRRFSRTAITCLTITATTSSAATTSTGPVNTMVSGWEATTTPASSNGAYGSRIGAQPSGSGEPSSAVAACRPAVAAIVTSRKPAAHPMSTTLPLAYSPLAS